MKPLLSYMVTTKVLDRLYVTMEYQKKWQSIADRFDRIILTDFTTEVKTDLPIHRGDFYIDGIFNQSKARNCLLKYAADKGYEWAFDGDADRVMLEMPEKMPEPMVACVPMHHALKDQSPEWLYGKWLSNGLNYTGSSFFVFHRNYFDLRFCEDFKWNGYEDLDFIYNICQPKGIPLGHFPDARAIHLWHQERYRENYEPKNKILYEQRKKELGE